jgi:hypothetical protein
MRGFMLTPNQSPTYHNAFIQYLRKGTPINLASAQQHPLDDYYVWHTRGDGKVRASHAENDGKIFSWSHPPITGHPGEDYGCRCEALPLPESFRNGFDVGRKIADLLKISNRWGNLHFTLHFYIGGGKGVTLRQTGNFETIKQFYEANYQQAFINQIINKVLHSPEGLLLDDFEHSYNFKPALYSLGKSIMRGRFAGTISHEPHNTIRIKGNILFELEDSFKDPLSTSEIIATIIDYIPFLEFSEEDLPKFIKNITNYGGIVYPITEQWTTELDFVVK